MPDPVALPNEVPVMPLPGALLFPHALLPLHIFETRYRAMLEHALAADRMFCVALVKPPRSDWRSPNDFYHIASVGLIRACVGRGDGTSNLILQGLQRVRFTAFSQEQPFPIARVEPLASLAPNPPVQGEALGARLLDFYEKFKGEGRRFHERLDRYLSELSDPEMLADLMAATFITDPMRRQQVLEQLSVSARLRLVIEYLHDESGDAAA
ncbi:MAG TPA: LON peptidase substrate-binding domain-containing protein [Chthoniobacterales bacterium]